MPAPKKIINNVVQEVAKANSTTGKLKSFPTFEDAKKHIFSTKHKDAGIMELGSTEQAIMEKFVEIIKEADVKNLLKEGPNNIITKINDKEVTIRAFIKNDHVISYNGFMKLSDRKVDNKIFL